MAEYMARYEEIKMNEAVGGLTPTEEELKLKLEKYLFRALDRLEMKVMFGNGDNAKNRDLLYSLRLLLLTKPVVQR